ncbi:MAG: LD-carboxypeptidase [Bacteroidota bacterium]
MINRRKFLQSSAMIGAAAAVPTSLTAKSIATKKKLIKPPALKKGDIIGLVTPGSPLFETQRTLIEAKEKLHNLGFKTKVAHNVTKKLGYLAGTAQERVDDLHAMFLDDEVKAIMAVRGGYGSAQMLPLLDYKLIAEHPKILIGLSDITSILNGIYIETGLVTFHGPVAISTFTDFTKKYFLNTLCSPDPVGLIDDAPYDDNLQTTNRVWTYRPGSVEGKLAGGNLTLLQSSIGTPYEFDSDGTIIFIEEVDEQPYDLDRMLNHLKQAGKFDKCKGVVFDKMKSVSAKGASISVEDVIDQVFGDLNIPVCIGLSFGHIKEKPTLPIGIKARLDAGKGQLSLLEGAVE